MMFLNGRAPRSRVMSSAESRSFVATTDDGKACRRSSFLTPERLRS